MEGGGIRILKKTGRISRLEEELSRRFNNHDLKIGIAHTRWATHGENIEPNAHPHTDCQEYFAVVHNGIIENYEDLRKFLEKRGHCFRSSTDTEVIPHLLEEKWQKGEKYPFPSLFKELEGSFALVILSLHHPGRLFFLRKRSPLVVGKGEDEFFIASDVHAILPYTESLFPLPEGSMGEISPEGIKLEGKKEKEKLFVNMENNFQTSSPDKYPHFMLKEIYDQPLSQTNLLEQYSSPDVWKRISGIGEPRRIIITACGTSYHAGLLGRLYIEKIACIPTQVEYASEFRYMNPVLTPEDLVILISQSGETADTLGVLERLKDKKIKHLSIVNVPFSTLERESEYSLPLLAGPERGVAATKTFTSQVTLLYLLAVYFGLQKRKIRHWGEIMDKLSHIPSLMEKILKNASHIKEIASRYFRFSHTLYLGRGYQYPIALEGALKLKEISYIHAEGYPAAEMKHGPLALVDENMPVVVVAPRDSLFSKIKLNVEEVKSRKGRVIVVTDEKDGLSSLAEEVILIPSFQEDLLPLLTIIPLQLLAYYLALERGCDVDKPRNLAKSVTVE